jgi:ribosomal protein S18 acetylase RimI-like enzyme
MRVHDGDKVRIDPARRAARAHDELVAALYGGELETLDGLRLLYNRFLEEAEWSHAGAIETGEAEWPELLVTVRDFFRRRQRQPALVTDPWTAPASLPGLLARDGWTEAFRHRGLLFPNQALLPLFEWPQEATIEELASPAPEAPSDTEPVEPIPFVLEGELAPDERRSFPAMDAFVSVFLAAFTETAPGQSLLGYRRAIPAGFERPRPGVELVHTVVTIDGEPAAVGSRVHHRGVAGLYNLGVAPRFRNRGLGGALTIHRVAEARSAGAELVYLLTEDPRVEEAQKRRGFVPAFELVGWTEATPEA